MSDCPKSSTIPLAGSSRRPNQDERDVAVVHRQAVPGPTHRHDLVYYNDRSVAEVGEILGIPNGTVKTRMFNARKRLATLLDDAGIDTVPANFAEMRDTIHDPHDERLSYRPPSFGESMRSRTSASHAHV